MLIAVLAGLAAAGCFAVTSVLQHVAAGRAPEHRPLAPSLLLRLARDPVWLLGSVADGVGVLLHAVALRFGSLLVVQPLLLSGLVIAVPLRAVIARRRPSGRTVGAAALCVTGLAVLLGCAAPSESLVQPSARVVAGGGLSVLALAAMLALRPPTGRPWRGLALAAAAGLAFGVSGLFLKLTAAEATHGLPALLWSWPTYALAVAGLAGTVLSQNAFQAGSLPLPLAVLSLTEPIVAALLGIALLGDRAHVGGLRGIAELLAFVVVALAVVLLTAEDAPNEEAPDPDRHSRVAGAQVHVVEQPDRDEAGEHRRAAVGHERQR